MKINIDFIEVKEDLSEKDKRRVARTIRETANHASKLLRAEGIVTFSVYPFAVACEPLVWGDILSNEWIRMIVPIFLNENVENKLKTFSYHEMHHLARGYYDYKMGGFNPFIDAIFSEGLAVMFEWENTRIMHPSSTYNSNTLQQLLPEVRKNLYNTDCSLRYGWFIQSDTGYRMGKYFVNLILAKNQDLNATKLARASTEELLDLLYHSGINLI